MGVLNLTPNSFSDGNKHLDSDFIEQRIQELFSKPISVLDVGAESTAPFNSSISEEEEKNRWQKFFFPSVKKGLLQNKTLSIDTYRPEVFFFITSYVKELSPQTDLIWNDISSVFDSYLLKALKKDSPQAKYIYCHQINQDRYQSSDHMKRVENTSNKEFMRSLEFFFENGVENFHKEKLLNRVFFDPCFGFSKTRDQNLFLLDNIEKLIFPKFKEIPWVLGISRKSFLQYLVEKDDISKDQIFSLCDNMAQKYYNNWKIWAERKEAKIIVRKHF